MFDATSRYAPIESYTVLDDTGRCVTLKKVRFIPDTPAPTSRRIVVGDRPDLLAHEFYRAPEQYWRIADANDVMHPGELVAEPGRFIKIPPQV